MFFYSIFEGLKIALSAIWQNKLRALLTTFGIIIGILSVTTMATVIDGIDRSFESSMEMLGKDVLYIQKWPWSFGPNYKWWLYINRPELKVEYASQLESLSSYATAVAAVTGRSEEVRFRERSIPSVQIQGATQNYTQTASFEMDFGRFYTAEEDRLLKNVCVIGSEIASELFLNSYPIDKEIRIAGQKYRVIGVMKKQGDFLGLESLDNLVVLPISTYGKFFGLRRDISLQVKFPDKQSMVDGQYEIEGLMRRIRQLDPIEENDFAVNKLDLFRQQYQSMTGAIYGVGLFLTALALFVGGIGVMNIMFVSVKERTREIGIRKAIGAKSWQILSQFLIEAVLVCGLGGIVAVFLSIGVTQLINQVFVAYMDWTTVVQALLICTFTGVAFGFFPAWKAAKADPISSLRYD